MMVAKPERINITTGQILTIQSHFQLSLPPRKQLRPDCICSACYLYKLLQCWQQFYPASMCISCYLSDLSLSLATAPSRPLCAVPVTFLNMDINVIYTAKQRPTCHCAFELGSSALSPSWNRVYCVFADQFLIFLVLMLLLPANSKEHETTSYQIMMYVHDIRMIHTERQRILLKAIKWLN